MTAFEIEAIFAAASLGMVGKVAEVGKAASSASSTKVNDDGSLSFLGNGFNAHQPLRRCHNSLAWVKKFIMLSSLHS